MTLTEAETEAPTLNLLGGPHVVVAGRRVPVPEGSKRLVAFVALNGRCVDRRQAATTLWPDVEAHRAAGNLRSAMWRLRVADLRVLHADTCSLSLHPTLSVDLEGVRAWADRLVAGKPEAEDLNLRAVALHALDLLPGWYDDWVLLERERLRHLLLQAIDALAQLLVLADRPGDAVEAALTAVSVEPLRESAQRALIDAHLAEGNRCEAWRSFGTYRDLLESELGIAPPAELARIFEQWPTRERPTERLRAALAGRQPAGRRSELTARCRALPA